MKGGSLAAAAGGDRLDLSEIFFSNEEYYSKLEELKKAHLRTMAELEGLYRHKLQLRAVAPLDATRREAGGHRWAALGGGYGSWESTLIVLSFSCGDV